MECGNRVKECTDALGELQNPKHKISRWTKLTFHFTAKTQRM